MAVLCNTGACLKSLLDPDSKALSFVAFSPNGKFVLAASLGGKLTLWEYERSKVVKTYQGAGPMQKFWHLLLPPLSLCACQMTVESGINITAGCQASPAADACPCQLWSTSIAGTCVHAETERLSDAPA